MRNMEGKLSDLLLEHSLSIDSSDTLIVDYQKHANKLFKAINKKAKKKVIELKEFPRPKLANLLNRE